MFNLTNLKNAFIEKSLKFKSDNFFNASLAYFILLIVLSFALSSVTVYAKKSNESASRLVLLGTAGGPVVKSARSQPANALIVNGSVYIIDAGDGVVNGIAQAGIPIKALQAVFITHNHSDHVADYGTLLLRAWESGLEHEVETYGPPPLEQMTRDYFDYMSFDINFRIKDEGRIPIAKLISAHNIYPVGASVIYRDANVTVTALQVPHGDLKLAYAYRFDTAAGCSVVFSGDTEGSQALIKLATGTDIFVHEVMNLDGVKAIVNLVDPGNETLYQHISEAHTPAKHVAKAAAKAGVNMLVLNHFVPTGLRPYDKPESWLRLISPYYDGKIVVGEDLMEIKLNSCKGNSS